MITKNYTTDSPFGKDEIGIIKIKFSGEHYLPKKYVRLVFGWKGDQVCDSLECSSTEGIFTSLAFQQSYYFDEGNKISVIYFLSCDVDKERFEDLSWLEKKILAAKKLVKVFEKGELHPRDLKPEVAKYINELDL